MSLSPAQLAALKTEFQTDPKNYGYAAALAVRNDTLLQAEINFVRDGTTTPPGGNVGPAITRNRTSVTQGQIIAILDGRDVQNITQGQAALFNAILCYTDNLGGAKLVIANQNGSTTLLRQNLDRLIGDTNGSQTRMNALAVRSGSRAEELFGTDASVSLDDVSKALNS